LWCEVDRSNPVCSNGWIRKGYKTNKRAMKKRNIVESEDNLYIPFGVVQKEVSHSQFPLSIFVPPAISDQYPPSFLPSPLSHSIRFPHYAAFFLTRASKKSIIDFKDKMKFIVNSNKLHEQ
jgi:hypothetical protein